MPRTVPKLALALALLALSGCQKPDVGAPCTMTWGSGTDAAPRPNTVSADYLETGNTFCDDQICIVSPTDIARYQCPADSTACGYCSKPCVSNADCYKSETGLVCRQMVLDPAFVAALQNDPTDADGNGIPDGQEKLERYLAQIRFSSYCAVPR